MIHQFDVKVGYEDYHINNRTTFGIDLTGITTVDYWHIPNFVFKAKQTFISGTPSVDSRFYILNIVKPLQSIAAMNMLMPIDAITATVKTYSSLTARILMRVTEFVNTSKVGIQATFERMAYPIGPGLASAVKSVQTFTDVRVTMLVKLLSWDFLNTAGDRTSEANKYTLSAIDANTLSAMDSTT